MEIQKVPSALPARMGTRSRWPAGADGQDGAGPEGPAGADGHKVLLAPLVLTARRAQGPVGPKVLLAPLVLTDKMVHGARRSRNPVCRLRPGAGMGYKVPLAPLVLTAKTLPEVPRPCRRGWSLRSCWPRWC